MEITKDTRVADILNEYGDIAEVMVVFGVNALLPTLSQEEAKEWRTARAQAEAEGTFYFSWPHHCAVGTKSS